MNNPRPFEFRTVNEAIKNPDVYTEARRLWREFRDRTDPDASFQHQYDREHGQYYRITNEQVWKAVENLRRKSEESPP